MGLSSKQILTFLPLNTWTPVFLIPGTKPDNGTCLISTSEMYLKRCNDMYEMASDSYKFEKVNLFQCMRFVALEIEGLWFRGKMLSYNEVLTKNTMVKLIDSGSVYNTNLSNLYQLPDKYKYDPLCLTIKPVNKIPDLILGQFYVQPLLSQSELHKGYVIVNTKPMDLPEELQLEINVEEVKEDSSYITINEKDNKIKQPEECSMNGTSINQKLDKSNNFSIVEELSEQDFKCEYTCELKEALKKEDMLYIKNILGDLDSVNTICLNPINIFNNEPKNLPVIEDSTYKVNNVESNNSTPILTNGSNIDDVNTAGDHLFQNGSSVEFSYGKNIDFVYIRSYEQKKIYVNEMQQFYHHYKINGNKKIHANPKYGDIVAAWLVNFNEIHRAVILKPSQKSLNQYHLCYFIDIGYKEYVKTDHIFLLQVAKHVPYLAHKVGLNYYPFNNTLQLKYLKQYFDQLYLQPLIIEFDEFDPIKFNKVILKRQFNNKNIFDEFNEFLQNRIPNSILTYNEGEDNFLSYNNVFKNGTVVVITYFCSIKKLFVRVDTPELTEFYNKLSEVTHHLYDNVKEEDLINYEKKNPRLGERIIGRSPSKKKFVRALIKEKISKTAYRLHYLDHGDEECISVKNMFVLPNSLRNIPCMVFKIGLDAVININKINQFQSNINQLIKSSVPFIAEFDEEDPMGFQSVVLKNKSNGINILDDFE